MLFLLSAGSSFSLFFFHYTRCCLIFYIIHSFKVIPLCILLQNLLSTHSLMHNNALIFNAIDLNSMLILQNLSFVQYSLKCILSNILLLCSVPFILILPSSILLSSVLLRSVLTLLFCPQRLNIIQNT